jgi:hypothetical protein
MHRHQKHPLTLTRTERQRGPVRETGIQAEGQSSRHLQTVIGEWACGMRVRRQWTSVRLQIREENRLCGITAPCPLGRKTTRVAYAPVFVRVRARAKSDKHMGSNQNSLCLVGVQFKHQALVGCPYLFRWGVGTYAELLVIVWNLPTANAGQSQHWAATSISGTPSTAHRIYVFAKLCAMRADGSGNSARCSTCPKPSTLNAER